MPKSPSVLTSSLSTEGTKPCFIAGQISTSGTPLCIRQPRTNSFHGDFIRNRAAFCTGPHGYDVYRSTLASCSDQYPGLYEYISIEILLSVSPSVQAHPGIHQSAGPSASLAISNSLVAPTSRRYRPTDRAPDSAAKEVTDNSLGWDWLRVW
jgi:hypothetical protein